MLTIYATQQILYDDYINERKAWERWEQEQAARQEYHDLEVDAEQYFESSATPGSGLETYREQHEPPQDDEIQNLLEKERHELEELVAMHEEEIPDTGTEETQMGQHDDVTRMPGLIHQQVSSPYLGPEDGDFEELLLDDDMDIS